MNKSKVKLFFGKYHYATILLEDIKDMRQNGSYWYIKMKDGNVWEDCTRAVITSDPDESIGYFVNN